MVACPWQWARGKNLAPYTDEICMILCTVKWPGVCSSLAGRGKARSTSHEVMRAGCEDSDSPDGAGLAGRWAGMSNEA